MAWLTYHPITISRAKELTPHAALQRVAKHRKGMSQRDGREGASRSRVKPKSLMTSAKSRHSYCCGRYHAWIWYRMSIFRWHQHENHLLSEPGILIGNETIPSESCSLIGIWWKFTLTYCLRLWCYWLQPPEKFIPSSGSRKTRRQQTQRWERPASPPRPATPNMIHTKHIENQILPPPRIDYVGENKV